MCEDGLCALTGESPVKEEAAVPFAFGDTTALKGNSAGSLGDNGEPVGAERRILGPPFEGEGMCISSDSFALNPARSGD
jgi:hypothetical protein